MDEAKIATLRDLTKFAPMFLKVKTKSGATESFEFNRAQKYIHEKIEEQLKLFGKVRALILKGRQQGCSTYIQARYFHKVITKRGKKAFILTHEYTASKNLFEMAKRFYDNLPKGLCPVADTSNAKELQFAAFDSGYSVGASGNKNTGRGQTVQLFHGSECAYWQHADMHAEGVMEAVSNEDGTEMILESTANGIGDFFHQRWIAAIKGESGYIAIFVPWYWSDEYTEHAKGFIPTLAEQELLDLYSADGLTEEHLAWRRTKISGFGKNDDDAGLDKFKQVYPFTAQEAFVNPVDRVLINSKYVARARKTIVESDTALVIGVDVAISDRDRTAIIRRRGRKAFKIEKLNNYNTMEICGYLKRIIDAEKPLRVYIDCIGIGAGVVDRMQEMGYACVVGVNVARTANDKTLYRNIRAELWCSMRDWVMQDLPVEIPDSDELHGEMCCLGYKETSNGLIQIESKDELRKRGMPSPDIADALALTFFSGFQEALYHAEATTLQSHERSMFR